MIVGDVVSDVLGDVVGDVVDAIGDVGRVLFDGVFDVIFCW